MKLVREHINEKFEEKSDPIKDMGIGDESWLIENKLDELANKHGFTSYSEPKFVYEDEIEEYGFKGVKFIKCWYKEGDENFREIVLYSYTHHDYSDTSPGIRINYGIYESSEEGESGGDKIEGLNDIRFFSDQYWKIEVD